MTLLYLGARPEILRSFWGVGSGKSKLGSADRRAPCVCPHAQAKSGKTAPLQSGGAFMLGGEQDCYGGCTDSGQAFYGLMDEVGGP